MNSTKKSMKQINHIVMMISWLAIRFTAGMSDLPAHGFLNAAKCIMTRNTASISDPGKLPLILIVQNTIPIISLIALSAIFTIAVTGITVIIIITHISITIISM